MSVAGKPISAIISEPLTYCGDAFFSPNELSVLWELVWRLDENGYGSVSQKTIELYTGLSNKTVGKMMNQLMKKGFIQKKRTTATDIIRTCNLSKNPYILVSEGVHYWISFVIGIFLPDQKGKKLESQFDSNVCECQPKC